MGCTFWHGSVSVCFFPPILSQNYFHLGVLEQLPESYMVAACCRLDHRYLGGVGVSDPARWSNADG